MYKSFPTILITGGDPSGIGPEIILKTLTVKLNKNLEACFIYYNTSGKIHKQEIQKMCLEKGYEFKDFNAFINLNINTKIAGNTNTADITKIAGNTNTAGITNTANIKLKELISNNKFILIDVCDFIEEKNTSTTNANIENNFKNNSEYKPENIDYKYCGAISFKALELACDFALFHPCSGILTAPISKERINLASGAKNNDNSGTNDFTGHTEYLAKRFNSDVLMLLHGKKFSVIPLTVHIPISKVPEKLFELTKNENLQKFIKLLQIIKKMPSYQNTNWALCALNPHAGENGLMGNEELKFLNNFSENLKNEGLPISSPLPSDTLFMKPNLNKYRLILTCYHDQGLIPFKALEGETGVNWTIGLPLIRTSPDHGTAFDIAGKNIANHESMSEALQIILENYNCKN